MTLRDDIEAALNRNSAENGSNTPDMILATFLTGCLTAFDYAVQRRDAWYSIAPQPGWDGQRLAEPTPEPEEPLLP